MCKFHELCDLAHWRSVSQLGKNAPVVKFAWPNGLESTLDLYMVFFLLKDCADSSTNTLQHRLILWVSLWSSFLCFKIFVIEIPHRRSCVACLGMICLLRVWEWYVWRRGAKNALQISTANHINAQVVIANKETPVVWSFTLTQRLHANEQAQVDGW